MDSDSDAEKPFESAPRVLKRSVSTHSTNVPSLPIKLPDGRIQQTGSRPRPARAPQEESENEPENEDSVSEPQHAEDVSTGARFGRPAVVDVIQKRSRSERLQLAREQIASLCQEIIAEPEINVCIQQFIITPLNSPYAR